MWHKIRQQLDKGTPARRPLTWTVGLLVSCAATALLPASCSGKAIIDPGGAGGNSSVNSATATVATTTAVTASSSGSAGGCNEDRPCPDGETCLWGQGPNGQGLCALICQDDGCGEGVCPAGLVCDACASSSCPECLDCISACRPARSGRCDDHSDCDGNSQLCDFGQGRCIQACQSNADCDSDAICNECGTSSCPCCEDCRGICVGTG